MKKIIGRILLATLIIAGSVMSFIEIGHDLLHRVSNPFHHHSLTHRNITFSHTVKDHSFRKMRFAYQMEEPAGPPNLVLLLFGACPLSDSVSLFKISLGEHVFHPDASRYLMDAKVPPTPPPLLS